MEFSQDLAYLLGLWQHCKYEKGVGIKGRAKHIFFDICQKLKLSEKFLYSKDAIYFYNYRIKKRLEKFSKERQYRFIAINDYSANYFAGWFDCCGSINNNAVKLCNCDEVDSFILTKLNFIHELKGRSVYIIKSSAFLRFIKDYKKLNLTI
ncbi:MAG: hypothetical protein QXS91_01885 [Candidatus Anstonellales archaeon]